MKLVGAIGLLASGKDAVINYLSLSYGLPVVSSGDITREIAMLEGKPLTRERLTEIAERNMSLDPGWYPKEVLRRIQENGWDTAAITGVRTYADIKTYKDAVGDDFVCFNVKVSDPAVRLQRVKRRKETRDPKTIEELLEHDSLEMRAFRFDKSLPLADVTINNDGTIEETQAQVDYYVRKFAIANRLKSPHKYWFLVGFWIEGLANGGILSHLQAKLGENVIIPMEVSLGDEPEDSNTSTHNLSLFTSRSSAPRPEHSIEGKEDMVLRRIVRALPRAEYICVLASDPLICLGTVFKSVVGLGWDNLAMIVVDTCLDTCAVTEEHQRVDCDSQKKATVWNYLSAIANPSYVVIHNPFKEATFTINCSVSSKQQKLDFRTLPKVSFEPVGFFSKKLGEISATGVRRACLLIRIDTLEDALIGKDTNADNKLACAVREVQQHFSITSLAICGHIFDCAPVNSSDYAGLTALIEKILRMVVYA